MIELEKRIKRYENAMEQFEREENEILDETRLDLAEKEMRAIGKQIGKTQKK